MLADNFLLLTQAYIQQEQNVDKHFDFHREGLKALLQINSKFLIEYITVFYTGDASLHSRDTHNQLPFVWDLDNYNELAEEAINLMIENSIYYGILEHPIIIFFRPLTEEKTAKAKLFLLDYISKYHSDRSRMNSVFDVIRRTMKDFFEEALLHYLNFNVEVEQFKQIWWTGNGGTYSGGVIIGDVRARDWQNLLAIVEKSKKQLDLIPIKAYIKKQIESNLKSAEEERKRRFIDPEKW